MNIFTRTIKMKTGTYRNLNIPAVPAINAGLYGYINALGDPTES
jgi:hypothetical protein